MHPQTTISWSRLAFFVWLRAPTLPRTRISACSRTAQVFTTTMSASDSSSVKPNPISASMPRSLSLSASFCWHP